ncbi:hypothetical protein EBU99_05710 [bacterium]|nr:hypothetical protein [bacterium]
MRNNLITVSACLLTLFGCQTTRLPSAQKSADNTSLLVQVSADQRSLMWTESQSKNIESLVADKRTSTNIAALQMNAELALLGHLTRPAIENAQAILRSDLRQVKAIKTLVKAALIEHKPHEALALCESALAHSPQDAELYSLQGLIQYQLENPLYAKALWNKALSIDPMHIPTLMNVGVLLFQNGHISKAGGHFDRVLAIQPNHLDAQVGRALVMSAQGQAQDAVELLEAVMKKTGDNALILENLAYISRDRLKDLKRASSYVERSLALGKSDRKSLEAAVGMRQELRRMMAAQERRMSDENLRDMAAQSANAAVGEQSSVNSNSASQDLLKMEESIK